MKLIFLLSILIALSCASSFSQTTYPATDCSQAQITAAIATEQASKVDGDVITIPSGTCTWTGTQHITQSFTNSVTISGAGAASATAGGASTTGSDLTTIIDNVNNSANNGLFFITAAPGKTVRITGIFFSWNSSSFVSNQPIVTMIGSSSGYAQARVDHCHFYMTKNGGGQTLSYGLGINTSLIGVADHNWFQTDSAPVPALLTNDFTINNGTGWNGNDPSGFADSSWAVGDNWGTNLFWFVEDSRFDYGDVADCATGGRWVLRHCTIASDGNNGQIYEHGMTGARTRGCRAFEGYNNTITHSSTSSNPMYSNNSGPALNHSNNVSGTNAAVTDIAEERDNNDIYQAGGVSPGHWGYCGPTPIYTGNVSVSSNSTAVTGSGFDTGWPAGSMIVITGASCTEGIYTGTSCKIASVADSSHLTLSHVSTATVTNGAASVGSVWDGNASSNGYPCLDAPARGAGDMLSGGFGSIVNVTQGSTQANPREALDPIYVWDNTYTPASGSHPGVTAQAKFTDNLDYFQQCGTNFENCGAGFNGTVGVGQGLYSAIPGTCTAGPGGNTPGVAYWATDRSTLYVCNPTNTWTAYYTPYIYPHPLTNTIPTSPAGFFLARGTIQ